MAIVMLGIDLAKNVFALHGVNEAGRVEMKRPSVPRAKLMQTVATLPPWTVAMEACSGAHHWAREFAKFGRGVTLLAPTFVTPFRMSGIHIQFMARCEPTRQLMRLCGIGETTATAMIAMVGNAHEFTSGRQFAAWLGLVPRQYSSGGKTRLGRITKAGDAYLRSLLVQGARAVIEAAKKKTDSVSR
jgi:transposase